MYKNANPLIVKSCEISCEPKSAILFSTEASIQQPCHKLFSNYLPTTIYRTVSILNIFISTMTWV